MSVSDLTLRRARRSDFTAVMHLLVGVGLPAPVVDRPTLRRFRHLVSDLGADFYLVFGHDELAGFVHATYSRRLAVPPLARVEQLVVAPAALLEGPLVVTALLDLVRRRAAKRGCSEWTLSTQASAQIGAAELEAQGLVRGAIEWRAPIQQADAEARDGR